MNTWTPLWSGIVDSSLWEEAGNVVKVFVTMLAAKDSDHICRLDAYRIGKKCHISEVEVLEILKILASPDIRRVGPQEHEGRRIQAVEDGWFILNGEKYRQMVSDEMRKARLRRAQASFRERQKKVELSLKAKTPVSCSVDQMEIPKELDTESFKSAWEEWLEHLRQKKKPPTDLSKKRQLKKLEKMGVQKAILTLNHCIERDWRGIYEPDNSTTARGSSGKPNPRNFGIAIGPTDYATAKPRLQREREAAEKAGVAGKVAANGNNPSKA